MPTPDRFNNRLEATNSNEVVKTNVAQKAVKLFKAAAESNTEKSGTHSFSIGPHLFFVNNLSGNPVIEIQSTQTGNQVCEIKTTDYGANVTMVGVDFIITDNSITQTDSAKETLTSEAALQFSSSLLTFAEMYKSHIDAKIANEIKTISSQEEENHRAIDDIMMGGLHEGFIDPARQEVQPHDRFAVGDNMRSGFDGTNLGIIHEKNNPEARQSENLLMS